MDFLRDKVFFFLIIVLFFSTNTYSNSIYLFYPNDDGIFRVKNPFETFDEVYVQNSKYNYKPYYDSIHDEFIVYVQDISVHQLVYGIENISNNMALSLSSVQEIAGENIYVHDMISKVSPNNWLYKMIQVGKEGITETFFVDNLSTGNQNVILLYLYNFSSQINPFSIEFNGLKKQYSIHNRGDTVLQFQLSELIDKNTKTLKMKIEDNAYDIGVLKIETDFMPIDFDASSYFPVFGNQSFICSVTYLDKSKMQNNDYQVFYVENGSLKKAEEACIFNDYNSIIVANGNHLQELKLHSYPERTIQKVSNPDVLILYHHTFEALIDEYCIVLKELRPDIKQIVSTDVFDIYCKYTAGQSSTGSIKAYVKELKPVYLILLGDANMKSDNTNMIPSFSYPHIYTHSTFVSDYNYSFLGDSQQPEIAVSRLPFNNSSELKQHIEKLKRKSRDEIQNTGNTNILFNFENKTIHHGNHINILSLENQGDISKLDTNSLLRNVKYVMHLGHGSYKGWKCMRPDDFYMKKALQLPYEIVDLSCWTGCFSLNKRNCFSEKLLIHSDCNYTGCLSSSGFISDKGGEMVINYLLKNPDYNDLSTLLLRLRQELISGDTLQAEDLIMLNYLGTPF
jgi:peptidase C25-like protein